MTTCPETAMSLGAYVVGALSPAERAEVEAHLGQCATCRDELAELAPLPGLLSRISLEEATAAPAATDDAMLERLLAAADRGRRDQGRRRWLAVAAAAAVVAGAVAAGSLGWSALHEPATSRVVAEAHGIRMQVDVVPVDAGTQLTLSLSGVTAEEHCRLVVVSDTGRRDVAGSWEATYTGTATIESMTAIQRDHVRRLVVQTVDGHRLVAADVPPVSA